MKKLLLVTAALAVVSATAPARAQDGQMPDAMLGNWCPDPAHPHENRPGYKQGYVRATTDQVMAMQRHGTDEEVYCLRITRTEFNGCTYTHFLKTPSASPGFVEVEVVAMCGDAEGSWVFYKVDDMLVSGGLK